MAEEFSECATSLKTAQNLIPQSEDDMRIKFCNGEYPLRMHKTHPLTVILSFL